MPEKLAERPNVCCGNTGALEQRATPLASARLNSNGVMASNVHNLRNDRDGLTIRKQQKQKKHYG
ncbi:MAG TPA: hypothetical protein VF437_06860 [Verrucomicrobiae bacterium]|jgi:hypothetical protein